MVQPDGNRRATIVDVAARANVSTTAVSKVIRNASGVSPRMRERVGQAIDELGYRPRAAARGMRGQTYTLGMMLPDLRNPFFPQLVDGIAAGLTDTQYQLFLGTSFCVGHAEMSVTDAMIDRGMDGLILVAPTAQQAVLDRTARDIPVVVIGRHSRSPVHDTVVDDDAAGAVLVVDHLADLGHRRIAHIAHRDTSPYMPDAVRAVAYRSAMESRGLADEIDIVSTSYTEKGGYDGARQLLARSQRPTAIFAGADIAAMGVLAALDEAGLSVPDDMSVAGYDNTAFAALSTVGLTSVDQDGDRIGREGVRLLLERLATRDRPSMSITTTPRLVVRRSTAAPSDAC